MGEQKIWQAVELLKTTISYFQEKGVDEARLSAELLLGHVLQRTRLELYLKHDEPVSGAELERFRALCRQRLAGRPVQYCTGEQYFYGLRFVVDERVLIPRPETELVVEHAMGLLGERGHDGDRRCRVLDIGTGSGCIAITMAHLDAALDMVALDCSPGALDVARLNVAGFGFGERVTVVEGDLFDAAFPELVPGGRVDMIVSNPPYISRFEWEQLEPQVRCHEPALALCSEQGLECYEAVIRHAGKLLTTGGRLVFELHADGAAPVGALMREAGFVGLVTEKDYGGFERILSGRLS